MIYAIQSPVKIGGSVLLPASKSISNRALILNALSESIYFLKNLSVCDDTEVMKLAFSAPQAPVVDIGAAGTSMRFLTAYYATLPGERVITGTERMKNRPIGILVDALREIGADIEYVEKEGYPPLRIRGAELKGGTISLDGSVSSQYISALMMIGPLTRKGLKIKLKGDLISKPYIRMTQSLMKEFGASVSWLMDTITIEKKRYLPVFDFTVESDWSAASYWYEMVALAKDVTEVELKGLNKKSYQGDAVVADLFEKLGVQTEFTDKGVVLRKTNALPANFKYNFVKEPDLAQTFVVTCALKNIPFSFDGLKSLKIKETDRIVALQNELRKLGYVLEVTDDSIRWSGERCEPDLTIPVKTYEDHRMALAFAPAALVLDGLRIQDPEVVSKSYPDFWNNLSQMGFKIVEI